MHFCHLVSIIKAFGGSSQNLVKCCLTKNKGWLFARFVKTGPFEAQPTARQILFVVTTDKRPN